MNNNRDIKSNIKIYFIKILLTGVILLFGTLIINKDEDTRALIFNNIYNKTISFASIKNIYNKYAGSVIPFEKIVKTKEVFNEKLIYNEITNFNRGVKLSLSNNYLVPIIDDGMVVYIGDKDDYNKTVIVENKDGVNILYGNMDKINVKLYDYVNKNDVLGTVKNNTLYLVFNKGDEYLDYKEFLK